MMRHYLLSDETRGTEVCYAMYELNIKLKDNRYLVVSYFDNNTDNIINILLESMVVQPRVPVPESENGVSCTLRTLFLKGIFTLLLFYFFFVTSTLLFLLQKATEIDLNT